jgi:hypothetical protein
MILHITVICAGLTPESEASRSEANDRFLPLAKPLMNIAFKTPEVSERAFDETSIVTITLSSSFPILMKTLSRLVMITMEVQP